MKKIIILFLFAIMANVACAQCSVSITSSNDTTNCGRPAAVMTAQATGTAPFNYRWDNTLSYTYTASVNNGGAYSVWIRDATGCVATAQITIYNDSSLPTLSISSTNLCDNVLPKQLTVTPTSGGNYTYEWNRAGGNGNVMTATLAETYIVTVTNTNNGCVTSASHQVEGKLAITLGNNMAVCATTNGYYLSPEVISLNNNGYLSAYNWSNNATSAYISPSNSGTYSVTVTNLKGCTATASVQLTAQNNTFNSTITASANAICPNGRVVLRGDTTGATYYYWYGSNNAYSNSDSLVISNIGTYTFYVTNGVCSATATYTMSNNLPVPTVSIAPNQGFSCTTHSTNLSATGGIAYAWSNGNQTANAPVFTNQGNTYTVTVTASNGCTQTASIVLSDANGAHFTKSSDLINLCGNQTIGVQPFNSTTTVLWSTSETQRNIVPQNAGIYTVTVTNTVSGCTETGSISVGHIGNQNFSASLTSTGLVSCAGTGATVSATTSGGTQPFTYYWTNEYYHNFQQQYLNSTTIPPSTGGIYTVKVVDAGGCSTTATVSVTQAQNTLQAYITQLNTGLPTCRPNGYLKAYGSDTTATYYYSWSNGSILQINQWAGQQLGQTYGVTITEANTWCTASASITVGQLNSVAPRLTLDATHLNCTGGDYQLNLHVQSNNPPYTISWQDNGALQDSVRLITANCGSNGCSYTASVSDALCSNSVSIYGLYPILPLAQMPAPTINAAQCNYSTGSISMPSAYYYNNPSTFEWSNGSNYASQWGLATGWYSVTITNPNCDTIHRNYFVPETCQTTISGYSVIDMNNNCTRDNGDTPLSYGWGYNNHVILTNQQTNTAYYAYPDNNGFYSTVVDTGHYIISHYYNYYNNCVNANLSCNNNSIAIYAQSINQVYQNNNFYYQSIAPTQYNLGLFYYKETSRPVTPRQFTIYYHNTAFTSATNTTITFTHDAAWGNITMLNGNAPSGSTPTSKTWNIGTLPLQTWQSNLRFTMELPQNIPLNTPLQYNVAITADGTDCYPYDNSTYWQDFVTNSYDPNDKTLLTPHDPLGGTLNDGSPLVYQIRFQNTGTDTAYTVVVRDTIDLTHLDKNTFKIIGASHNMQTEWIAANIVEFRFPNIYLVDSFRNEPASHGFLQFSITPKPNTPMQSTVNNSAAIFFDYNDAVLTNTVRTVFVAYLASPAPSKGGETVGLVLVPNPTVDKVNLMVNNIDNYTIIVTDVFGRTIVQTKNATMIDLSSQPAGTYFVTVASDKGRVTKRVVKL